MMQQNPSTILLVKCQNKLAKTTVEKLSLCGNDNQVQLITTVFFLEGN